MWPVGARGCAEDECVRAAVAEEDHGRVDRDDLTDSLE